MKKYVLAVALALVPTAAYANHWLLIGHEVCVPKWQTLNGIKSVINGCSPDPGRTDLGTRMLTRSFADQLSCLNEAAAIAAEDPPYTNAACIEMNN